MIETIGNFELSLFFFFVIMAKGGREGIGVGITRP